MCCNAVGVQEEGKEAAAGGIHDLSGHAEQTSVRMLLQLCSSNLCVYHIFWLFTAFVPNGVVLQS